MKFPFKPGDMYVWKTETEAGTVTEMEMKTVTIPVTAATVVDTYTLRWEWYSGWWTAWTFMHREVTR